MLNADGTELRQRAAAKALNERVNYEQDILTRRRKMAEEDRTPTNPWIIVGFIVMFFVCLWAGWFFIIRHGKHWIIDQIHYGKVETVRMFLQEHHDLAMIDALDAVRGVQDSLALVPSTAPVAILCFSCLAIACAHVCTLCTLSTAPQRKRCWFEMRNEHAHLLHLYVSVSSHTHKCPLFMLTQHHEALIHHAVESNQPEIVSLLVEYGAKVSVKNSHGQMPLHLAVYHGWPKMVKTLVEHEAPLTVPDDVRA
jgi:hypothetical protein